MGRQKKEGTEERQRAYTDQYQKEHIRRYVLKLNRKTEPDMVEWLESHEHKQTYLKSLIKADMEKER